MNVINKLKSKKHKQPSTLSEPQQPQYQTSQQTLIPQQPQKKLLIPSTVSHQPQLKTHTSTTHQINEGSSQEQDLYQTNIQEYYLRKEKRMQMISKLQNSRTISQDHLDQRHYNLQVKKFFNIADICVLQGQLTHKNQGRQIFRRKVKLSCCQDAIQFPQNIGKLVLSNLTMFNQEQGVFLAQNIIKITQKGHPRK